MATSGTTAFTMDFADIVEEAYERAGLEARSGYDMRTARRSLDLIFLDWGNRGYNMWTVEQKTVSLTQGTGSYTLDTDAIQIVDMMLRTGTGTDQQDRSISRVALPQWANIPNKNDTGVPVQVYVDRQRDAFVAYVWPVPEDNTYTLVYWALRQIEETGDFANNADVPKRFLPALIAELALRIGEKNPARVPIDRLAALKMSANEAWQMAVEGDRDKSSFRIVPKVSRAK